MHEKRRAWYTLFAHASWNSETSWLGQDIFGYFVIINGRGELLAESAVLVEFTFSASVEILCLCTAIVLLRTVLESYKGRWWLIHRD